MGLEISTASLKALTEMDKAILDLFYIQLLFDNRREDGNKSEVKKVIGGEEKINNLCLSI